MEPRVVVAGSINMDLVARVPRLPVPGETLRGGPLAFHPGGKGANQAVAAARAGAPVTLCACLGRDAYGDELVAILASQGVDTSAVARVDQLASGVALILVDEKGENTIVTIAGANAVLPAAAAAAIPRPGDVCLAQFETPQATTEAFFEAARVAGARTVLNAAPGAGPADVLALTDILVVNEVEVAACLGEAVPPDGDALASAAQQLRSRGPSTVVVTLGARGLIATDQGRMLQLAAYPVQAIDTTGAGDCFVGSLAARLAAGDPVEPALRYANAAASLSVERPGAGPSMPSPAEVRQRLQSR